MTSGRNSGKLTADTVKIYNKILLSHTCHTEIDETRIFVGIYAIDKHGVIGRKPNLCLKENGARGQVRCLSQASSSLKTLAIQTVYKIIPAN